MASSGTRVGSMTSYYAFSYYLVPILMMLLVWTVITGVEINFFSFFWQWLSGFIRKTLLMPYKCKKWKLSIGTHLLLIYFNEASMILAVGVWIFVQL